MAFSSKQLGVLRGMALGATIAVALVAGGIALNPFGFRPGLPVAERLAVLAQSLAALALCLAVSIGRLARHRFLTPEDIDGGGVQAGSERAVLLQSLLQNTLEQSVLAAFVYMAWALLLPSAWLSVVPLAAAAFVLGRVLFFAGYRHGAPARALGFTLAFYPSIAMLVCILGAGLAALVTGGS